MRLEWLEDILAVAETGSFSDAAERRLLTQSAFSRRIRGIEAFLGVELFDRSRKPVHLRPATAEQRDQVARLASDLRQLIAELRHGERRAANRAVIASQHALTTALTPAILQELQGAGTDVFLKLRSANLDECFSMLLSRQADLALVYRLPGQDHPIRADYIETAVIGADRLSPVLGAAAAADAGWGEGMRTLPYIAYPNEVFLGQVLERRVMPAVRGRSDPLPRAETALTLAALEMARVGLGVAWVPQSLAAPRIADGSLTDLSDRLPEVELEVTAVRLVGTAGPVESAIWRHLSVVRSVRSGQANKIPFLAIQQ